ncbi:MAG TPA: FecR domain-containing protein [Rhizomicrobium sp.]|nr:FecR domain-containing protein [Rhizomicrobium sp.]
MRTENQTAPLTGTRAIKDMAADWLERSDRSDWGEQNVAELEAWLSQSPAHRLAYWRVKSAWERAQRLHALHPSKHVETTRAPWMLFRPIVFRTAAVLGAVAILGLAMVFLAPRSQEQTFSTRVGGHKIISFADGTQVELNTNTTVRTKLSSHERTVVLEHGEAYFRVTHNASRPFSVIIGNRRVTDLGTEFLVRRDDSRFEVALAKGRARFEVTDGVNNPSVLLVPGDAIVEKGGSISLVQETASELTDELAWRRGLLVFSHTTLADAASEFNRYNTSKIAIADPATASITIGGTFATNNVAGFVQLARNLLGLHVQSHGNAVVISR